MATLFDFGRKLITKSKDFGKSLVPPKQPYMANKKQREIIKGKREAAFDKQIKTGAAVTTVGGTAAYLMSGDAKIGPVAKPSASSASPARTPVASKPTQEIVPWRDRASIAKAKQQASSTPSKSSGISTGSSSKSMSRKGGKVSVPNIRNSDVRGAFRKAGERTTTAMQATKSRYLAGQAKRAAKTQSIAKTPEISKRYDLSPKEAGDKLLQTASSLFPKSSSTAPKITTPKVTKAPKPKRLATDSARGYLAKLNRYEADNKPKKPVAPRGPKPIQKPSEPKRNYLVRLKRWEAGK